MVTMGAPINYALAQLETLAVQLETIIGPLAGIGNDGKQTVFSFDDSADPPATALVLRPTVGGTPVPLPGKTMLCSGNAIVAGNEQNIAAFR